MLLFGARLEEDKVGAVAAVWLIEVITEVIMAEAGGRPPVIQEDIGKTTETGRGAVGRLMPAGGAANRPMASVFNSLSVLGCGCC